MINDIELDKVVITDNNSTIINAESKTVKPSIQDAEFTVIAKKKEYSIVGDSLYATINSDEAPQWLNATIDSVIDYRLNTSLADLRESQNSLLTAIGEIQLANNSYNEFIQYTDEAEQRAITKIDQAQVNLGNSIAANTSLIDTRVTADSASSIAGNVIEASINSGSIGAKISELSTAIVDTNTSFASSIELVEAELEDLNIGMAGNAAASQELYSYVGVIPGTGPDGTGLLQDIEILQKQNDGVIETVTGTYDVMIGVEDPNNNTDNDELDTTKEPYATWIAADTANGNITERSRHVGDVYIKYTSTTESYKTYDKAYKFIRTVVDTTSPYSTDSEGFTWALITDTDAQNAYVIALNAYDLANNKRRVFVGDTLPTPPYDIGDLWVIDINNPAIGTVFSTRTAQKGDILKCIDTKGSLGTYENNDWVPADSYREAIEKEKQKLEAWKTDEYGQFVTDINQQVDKKAESFYQDTAPHQQGTNTNYAVWVGDLWKNPTDANKEYVYQLVGNTYKWVEMSVPDIVFDTIDTKKSIYTGNTIPSVILPDVIEERDIWIPENDVAGGYYEGKIYVFNNGSWDLATKDYVTIFGESFDSIDDWVATANDTLVLSTDSYSSNNSGLFTSTDTTPTSSGSTGGVFIQVVENGVNTAGKKVLIEFMAKKPSTSSSNEFALAYSTNSVGNSNWNMFTPTTNWEKYSFSYNVNSTNENMDYLGVWGDTSASGLGVLIDDIKVKVLYEEGINGFIDTLYTPKIANLKEQVDDKVEYWYQLSTDTDPNTWPIADNAKHNGDILHYTDTNKSYYFNGDLGTWKQIRDQDALDAIQDAANAQATADGKVNNYYAYYDPNDIKRNEYSYWLKTDGKMYHQSSTNVWVSIHNNINYSLGDGDLATIKKLKTDGTVDDHYSYYFNGTSWVEITPDGIVSSSGGITTLKSSLSTYANLFNLQYNDDWSQDTSNISTYSKNTALKDAQNISIRNAGVDWAPNDRGILEVKQDAPVGTTSTVLIYLRNSANSNSAFLASENRKYSASVYLGTHRCYARLRVMFRDISGGHISSIYSSWSTNDPGSVVNPDTAPLKCVSGIAPAETFYIQMTLEKTDTYSGQTSSYVFVHKPMLSEVKDEDVFNEANPLPYAPTGVTGGQYVTGLTSLKDTLDLKIEDGLATAESNFAYDSVLNINGQYYSSGFGLKTTGSGGTTKDTATFDSEFWINAEKLKFTNTDKTGSVAPFTIDINTSDTDPQITFNGKVNFSNVSDAPSGIVTADDLSSTGTTIIDGDRIHTTTLSAIQSDMGNIDAGSLNINDKFIVASDGTVTIKNEAGTTIFSSGTGAVVNYSDLGGTKPPSDADKTSSNIAAGISEQGDLATKNTIDASTYIESGVITDAHIENEIKSTNFISGSTGWRIQKTGEAEFNDVVISRPQIILSGNHDSGSTQFVIPANHSGGWLVDSKVMYIDTGYEIPTTGSVKETYSAQVYFEDGTGGTKFINGYSSEEWRAYRNAHSGVYVKYVTPQFHHYTGRTSIGITAYLKLFVKPFGNAHDVTVTYSNPAGSTTQCIWRWDLLKVT